MAVCENIEFGKNYAALKAFVDKAVARFPGYKPVAELKNEAYDIVNIYEKEYNVGDTLPYLELENASGKTFSTKSFTGKYYLIDIWAPWYPGSFIYNYYKSNYGEITRIKD